MVRGVVETRPRVAAMDFGRSLSAPGRCCYVRMVTRRGKGRSSSEARRTPRWTQQRVLADDPLPSVAVMYAVAPRARPVRQLLYPHGMYRACGGSRRAFSGVG